MCQPINVHHLNAQHNCSPRQTRSRRLLQPIQPLMSCKKDPFKKSFLPIRAGYNARKAGPRLIHLAVLLFGGYKYAHYAAIMLLQIQMLKSNQER